MATTIPIEVYEILEDKLGREQAHAITKAMEEAAAVIAIHKKTEIRDELSRELASKADILAVRFEIMAVKYEIKLYFAITIAIIIITNPKALELIAKMIGVMK